MKSILGVTIPQYGGPFNVIRTSIAVAKAIPDTNLYALMLSLTAFAAILFFRFVETRFLPQVPRLFAKWFSKKPEDTLTPDDATDIPPAPKKQAVAVTDVILTVVLVAVVTTVFDLASEQGISVIGEIPSGFPPPRMPWELFNTVSTDLVGPLMLQMLPSVISLSLVCFVTTYSITKTFEVKTVATLKRISVIPKPPAANPVSESTRDLFALSLATIASSFLSCYVPSGSVARSAVLANQTNVSSPLGSLVCTGFVVIILMFLGPLFQNVPISALAAIILMAILGLLLKIKSGVRMIFDAKEQGRKVAEEMNVVRGDVEMTLAEGPVADLDSTVVQVADPDATLVRFPTAVADIAGESGECGGPHDPKKELTMLRFKLIEVFEDAIVWWITFVSVSLVDVGIGIMIGMAVKAVFLILYRVRDFISRK
ncbi:hypothetical protein HDU98_005930 [Podochytrium sp. JEL0797]|nr:hypothetical protein HDU98_005930 [Podochytrium sp. JEL0797]